MSSPWPTMHDWEATLPDDEPDRLIAHTELYKQHNNRLKAIHDAEAVLGKFPDGASDESVTATRAELAGILARLRARCTKSK